MEYHPFANVWPLLEGPKFDALVADIRAHGLHYPIKVYQQMVLDGRNRDRACIVAGVPPRYEPANVKNDHEALMLSASLNEHRRHMSEDDLAFVASKLANIPRGGDMRFNKSGSRNQEPLKESKVITREEAANAVGVTEYKLDSARAIHRYAPELEKEVKEKKLSFFAAAEEARARRKAKKAPLRKTAAEVQAANAAKAANHTRRELTRRDVDPEFVGDEIAFVTEYGHVWMQTSQERSTSRLAAWAMAMRHLARSLDQQHLPTISPVVLSWLREPNPGDIGTLRRALAELELAVATARDLLERAQTAVVTHNNGHDKSHGVRGDGA